MHSDLPDVTVIIVTFNASQHIEACLKSLFKHSSPLVLEVIVSDNSSTDGTPDLVRKRFPQVIVLEGKNRGFGAGNNRGIRISRGRYILVLNDDTIVLDGALKKMVAFMYRNPLVGLIGPKLLNPDGTLQPSIIKEQSAWKDIASLLLPVRLTTNTPSTRRILNNFRCLNPRLKLGKFEDHGIIQDIDCVKGACMMVNRRAVEQVGMFDERIFLQAEEADWAYRFRLLGWRVVFFPEAEIIHLDGTTIGSIEGLGRRFIQKHKSHIYLFGKHKGRIYVLVYKLGLGFTLMIRMLLMSAALIVPFGIRRATFLRQWETYATTFRLLWDEEFAKRNIFTEMNFKHF